jgi:hypothetical protein
MGCGAPGRGGPMPAIVSSAFDGRGDPGETAAREWFGVLATDRRSEVLVAEQPKRWMQRRYRPARCTGDGGEADRAYVKHAWRQRSCPRRREARVQAANLSGVEHAWRDPRFWVARAELFSGVS